MKISKKLSEQNAPPSLLPPTPLILGLSYGEQSLQSPTLTRPPARGSSNALMLQSKKPHLLPCGSITFTLTRRSLVLMPSLFRCYCKFKFLCPSSASLLSSCYSWYLWTWYFYSLNFLITIDLRRGYTWRLFWRRLIRPFCLSVTF